MNVSADAAPPDTAPPDTTPPETAPPQGTPAPYSIPATASLEEKRPRTLKYGDLFAVFDRNGNIPPGQGVAEGLYFQDTRHLSQLDLLVSGQWPILLSSTLRDDNATLTCDLTNPDLSDVNGSEVEHDLVHIRRTKFLWQATSFERIAIRNFGTAPQELTLTLRFAADFADLFEVRGRHRAVRGAMRAPVVTPDCVTLSYTGLDDRTRITALRFAPMPVALDASRAEFAIGLPPGGMCVLHIDISCDPAQAAVIASRPPLEAFFVGIRDARRELRALASRAASIDTSNTIFNEAARRSIADIYMLVTNTPQGAYPYAGIPWYSTAFGRDALITALMMLWLDPSIASGVLRYLAANQATTTDPASDAEPGKILHEVRLGEMAELGEVPFRRYYGSVDSTPLFVMLAGAWFERTGDVPGIRSLWPNIVAALDWIDTAGDRDGDGLVEYGRMTQEGLVNQGWKDSFDSIFHADGKLAIGPIALVEVQGYVHAARLAAAAMARGLGETAFGDDQQARAATLRAQIERSFWSDRLGTYVIALDRDKRPCEVRSSNAGHLLMCGVPSPDRAARVAEGLMGSAFFSGWGIRTLAAGEVRYNPMSYHNGSVWPHDNALIGLGLARYGMRAQAGRVLEALFDASTYIDLRRLPELLCGFPRRRNQGPTFYPVACSPQAWSAVAPLSLLQACLGVRFHPGAGSVELDKPVLPPFLERVILRNLTIGDAHLDLLARGEGDRVAMTVLRRSGAIRAMLTA